MARLTRAQEKQAWRHLMTLHDNTDKDISKLMGLPVGPVRIALYNLEKKKMERINKRVNKNYEKRKEAERFYAEQERKILVQSRKGDKNLVRIRDEPGKSGANGLDNKV